MNKLTSGLARLVLFGTIALSGCNNAPETKKDARPGDIIETLDKYSQLMAESEGKRQEDYTSAEKQFTKELNDYNAETWDIYQEKEKGMLENLKAAQKSYDELKGDFEEFKKQKEEFENSQK